MNHGGAFFSRQLPPKGDEDPRDVIRQNCIVWGTATKDAVEVSEKSHEVRFRVRWGEERVHYPPGHVRKKGEPLVRTKFMLCHASGKSNIAAVMAAIEKNDMVLCLGRTSFKKHRAKNGKLYQFYEMTVDMIFPMGLAIFAMRLCTVPEIQKLLEREENADADPWESG